MTIETTVSGNARVIACTGAVTLNDGRDLMVSTVNGVLDQGGRQVVLDLRQVPYMDSAGIGGLVLCSRQVARRGGELRIVAPPDGKVRQVLSLAGLDEVLRIFDDTNAEALRFTAGG